MQKKQENLIFFASATLFVALLFGVIYTFAEQNPGGTDFLYRWLPTRLFFFEGYDSLYSPEVEYQVELVHHGHAHLADETPGIFAYPFYTSFFFLPFTLTNNFLLMRAVWTTFSALAHLALIMLTLRMIGFQPGRSIGSALFLFALFSAEFTQALIDGNPSSLAALFAFLALFAIRREQDRLAGVLLAFSTVKPQLVILFFLLVWLWAFSKRRWEIIFTSAGTLLLLMGISFALQPSWLLGFITDIRTYTGVASPSTPRAILSFWMSAEHAQTTAWILSFASALILFSLWKSAYQSNFMTFFWVAAFTFVLMPFTGITSAKSNFVAMLPAAILLIERARINKKSELLISALLTLWIPLSWYFLVLGRTWMLGERLIYFFDFYPLPALLIILYYWLRPSPPPNAYRRL